MHSLNLVASRSLAALSAVVLLSGCERTPTPTTAAATAETVAEQASQAHPGAVEMVAQSAEEIAALQRLKTHWSATTATDSSFGQMQHVLLGRHVVPGTQDGGTHLLLVYASRPVTHDCSACVPDLSFFEFQPESGQAAPSLVMTSLAAASLGDAGEPPHHRVHAWGDKRYGVSLFWNEYGQGIYSSLALLTPINGQMREVFAEQIGANHDQVVGAHGGEFTSVHWKTLYRFSPGSASLQDLHLERHFLAGKRFLLDTKTGPFAAELTSDGRVPTHMVYRFDGQRYQRVLASQRAPQHHGEHWWSSDLEE